MNRMDILYNLKSKDLNIALLLYTNLTCVPYLVIFLLVNKAGKSDTKSSKISEIQIEKRNLISSVFIATLFAIAFGEVIITVKESIYTSGLTLQTSILFLIFFLTCTRFFIGNQLHLLGTDLVKLPGKVWFFDFLIIMIETIILVFIAGMCSSETISYMKWFILGTI